MADASPEFGRLESGNGSLGILGWRIGTRGAPDSADVTILLHLEAAASIWLSEPGVTFWDSARFE